MKAQEFVCLFCRHDSLLRPPLRSLRRWNTVSTPHKRQPNILPRTVTDLDAADNLHHTDSYDVPPDGQAHNTTAPVRRVGYKSRAISHVDLGESPSLHELRLDQFSAMPIDLVTYVLLADNHASSAVSLDRRVASHKSGIPYNEGGLAKLHELTSTFILNDEARFRRDGFYFTEGEIQKWRERIRQTYTLDSLQRTISIFSTTKRGCEILAQNGNAIGESIRLCRRRQRDVPGLEVPAAKVLRMLNNLHRNMESKGVDFGAALCNRALYYAAKVGSLPAVKMYLELLRKHSYEFDWYGHQAPTELLTSYTESPYFSSTNSPRSQAYRTDFLTFLTGWEDGIPKEGKARIFSIRSLLRRDQITHTLMFYRKYIFAIAQLGLTETLLAEWKLNRRCSDSYMILRSHLFALAFSIAGDSAQALQILSSNDLPKSSDVIGIHVHKAYFHESALRGMINDHYRAKNLDMALDIREQLREDLHLMLPLESAKALQVLEKYLLRDYEGGIIKRKVVIEKLEDGTKALMVWPLEGGRPLFAKAFTPSLPKVTVENKEKSDKIA